uniref:TonB-dependent receptor n=1 Tax=Sphingomonas sp. JE1 TaxID=1628059 RepID=A0A0D5A043_9SPHN|nr:MULTISPECIES: TonB-dependent receptor [unclassified Sphingomonas]AJW29541.1 TonB-dependent receptor [Sphingomonas sp. JE1]
MISFTGRRMLYVTAAAIAVTPTSALAQSAAAPSTANEGLGDIIVTAQKREQSLKDVGMTITAQSGEQLQALGVTNIQTLTKAVPGLTIAADREGLPTFSIRGIGFIAAQLSAAPTVSVYVDEAPLPYPALTGGVALDLERVEVLKGPQGTLFGNNSTGGSINFIAAKPTNVLSAGVRSSIDRFGQFNIEGFASGPVTDTLNVRIAGSTTQGGDWQRTYTPGPKLKTGGADRYALRVLADWRPSDSAKFLLHLSHYADKSDPQALQLSLAAPSGGPGSAYVDPVYGSVETYPLPPHDNRAADITQNPARKFTKDDEQYQASLRGDFDLSDNITLTSITNYAHLRFYVNRDADATRIDMIQGSHLGTIETYGQELRLTGDFDNLNVIVGANASKDKIHEEEPYFYPHFSILPPNMTTNPVSDFTSKTIAVFANAEWKVSNQFTLTGGARYTRVRQSFSNCFEDPGDGSTQAFVGGLANLFRSLGGLPPTNAYSGVLCNTIGPAPDFLPVTYSDKSTDHNVSWRIGSNFKINSDLMIYGLISRGYKAGGYPFVVAITQDQLNKVRQEKITAYEAGLKFSRGRTLSISTAGFYYDYVDKQTYALVAIPLLGPNSVLRNIPKSKAYGWEAELTVSPTSGLTLHGALTYTKTKIVDPGPLLLDGFGRPIDYRGNGFAYAPKFSAIFDTEYRLPVGTGLEAVLGMSGVHNSKSTGSIDQTAPFFIKAFTTVDMRVGLESEKGWSATAWIRNLTNTYCWTDANFIGDGYARTAGLPRNFGLTLAYRF